MSRFLLGEDFQAVGPGNLRFELADRGRAVVNDFLVAVDGEPGEIDLLFALLFFSLLLFLFLFIHELAVLFSRAAFGASANCPPIWYHIPASRHWVEPAGERIFCQSAAAELRDHVLAILLSLLLGYPSPARAL
ncbi:MAG TPA: hypothetical protein V6D17_22405 [Candidatus Obscuribacterales bacterium]